MKGKRYTTEDKIRILREGDRGKSILEVCRAHNISEVSFHRWKRQYGQMDLHEARKLKELESENGELKKMLAEALLKNRVLEAVAEKNGRPGASQTSGPRGGSAWAVLRAGGVPHPAALTRYFLVSVAASDLNPAAGWPDGCGCSARSIPATATGASPPFYARKDGAWAKRHIQRLRRADGLRVPPTKRKLVRRGISTGLPTKATHLGHVWTWDFISDATVRGGTLKMLNILDEHTRECHVRRPERALRAADVLALLERGDQRTRCAGVPAQRQRPGVHRQRGATLVGRQLD